MHILNVTEMKLPSVLRSNPSFNFCLLTDLRSSLSGFLLPFDEDSQNVIRKCIKGLLLFFFSVCMAHILNAICLKWSHIHCRHTTVKLKPGDNKQCYHSTKQSHLNNSHSSYLHHRAIIWHPFDDTLTHLPICRVLLAHEPSYSIVQSIYEKCSW